MPDVTVQGVTVAFGSTTALDNVSFTVKHGELFFLMGPSGCGKTTLLRTIAGLQAPTAGKILFGAKNVTNVPIRERGTAIVFQSYCLWPHMTVTENIAFGLSLQKLARKEVTSRVEEILEVTDLSHHKDKYPDQLSGGQQQRVSLARALVLRPKLLLLDEPFSNLDRSIRASIREEIKRVKEKFDLTLLFVSHDFEEAANIGSRVLFMNKGSVEAAGIPGEVYRHPPTKTVADLTGEVVTVPTRAGDAAKYCRPEAFVYEAQGTPNATVLSIEYESSFVRLLVELIGTQGTVPVLLSRSEGVPEVGASITVRIREDTFFNFSRSA